MFATATLAMMGVGTLMQAYSQYQSNKAQQQAYQYNAALGEMQTKDALDRGDQLVQQHYAEAAQVKGSQVAAIAANGGDVGYGSALDVLTSTDINASQDAQVILANARREALGYQSQSAQDQFAAANIYPKTAAFTTALAGSGQVASQWYQFKTAGAV
jgi:hypothetical protein